MSDNSTDNQPETEEEANEKRGMTGRWSKAGVGAAIGSAAVVAALLYVNRNNKKEEKEAPTGPIIETD